MSSWHCLHPGCTLSVDAGDSQDVPKNLLISTGWHHRATAVLLALGAAAPFVLLQASQSTALYRGSGLDAPLYAVDSTFYDWLMRTRRPEGYASSVGADPRGLITLIAMDDKSLAELGVFRDWPRTYYAELTKQLLMAPPRVIAFDVGFFDSAPEDWQLAQAFDRARALRPATSIVIGAVGGGEAEQGAEGFPQFRDGLQPVPAIAEHAEPGLANVLPDGRGNVRSMPLAAYLGQIRRPALGLVALASYLRLRDVAVQWLDSDAVAVVSGARPVRRVPVDRNGRLTLSFFGPPSQPGVGNSTFRVVSFVDVLRGRADPTGWRDGIVFVGLLGATGFADDWWTPASQNGRKMSGVELHANLTATLLSAQYQWPAPLWADLALLTAVALLVGLLAAYLDILAATAATVLVLGAAAALVLTLFDLIGIQLSVTGPLGAGALAFGSITSWRVAVEHRRAHALQAALALVIPPGVASTIARDPSRIRLGGERRVISVLFADLQGFTSFSENADPAVLNRVLTQFLDAMTEVVFHHGGTLDKFIGDAVMAFWNAPLDDREHAYHACQAALAMQANLRLLSDQWETEGLARQRMRIGIHTGEATVGNLGSSRRMAYTAIGDTVNLAARLESVNAVYGTWICASAATLTAAGGEHRYLVRSLDLVTVKGRRTPVPVFELLGEADGVVEATDGPRVNDANLRDEHVVARPSAG